MTQAVLSPEGVIGFDSDLASATEFPPVNSGATPVKIQIDGDGELLVLEVEPAPIQACRPDTKPPVPLFKSERVYR